MDISAAAVIFTTYNVYRLISTAADVICTATAAAAVAAAFVINLLMYVQSSSVVQESITAAYGSTLSNYNWKSTATTITTTIIIIITRDWALDRVHTSRWQLDRLFVCLINGRGIVMDYLCAKFDDLWCGQTDTHIVTITDATKRLSHATVVGMSNNWTLCISTTS